MGTILLNFVEKSLNLIIYFSKYIIYGAFIFTDFMRQIHHHFKCH